MKSFNLDECIQFIENYFLNEKKSNEVTENQDEIKQIMDENVFDEPIRKRKY